MSQYDELHSPDYTTVTVVGNDPDSNADPKISNSPANVTPNRFVFSGLGSNGQETAELVLQIGEFAEGGFNGIPPEAVLLALQKHYEGLQQSSIACAEYRMVANLLNDCVGSLKGRNDQRQWQGKYGTIEK